MREDSMLVNYQEVNVFNESDKLAISSLLLKERANWFKLVFGAGSFWITDRLREITSSSPSQQGSVRVSISSIKTFSEEKERSKEQQLNSKFNEAKYNDAPYNNSDAARISSTKE
ncbi:hypothetical protein CHS0354_010354 [Potamilus streckersoni]|uniref:Uncharacterized protein n=1 Tax=Potamilus streckersoni TaxID=2493646 RepID=A0AAE0WBV2_9BIVA|nr:hypothetical protein CHS0354_010354 [Potamilus streckersoni]